MTAAPQWEEVVVPQGQFIGWGLRPPQHVTGKVLSFSINGGTDVKGNECPQLALELTETCDSFRDKGTVKESILAGELVMLNAGQVSLKRSLIAAQPAAGDLIKISFESTIPVQLPGQAGMGEVKEFKVRIARGAGGTTRPAAAAPVAAQAVQPPF